MNNELMEFNHEQINLIKSQIAKDATDNELKLFLNQCRRTGLDPLTRQIYFVKRGGRMTIQTSIDGFRVIAERSGSYAGQDAPVWTYKTDGSIDSCNVTVHRFGPNGQRYPAGVGVAFFDEYYPNPVNLQKTLSHTMIAKVAEALALRKAFPQDLSGLYTGDEMQQAEVQQFGISEDQKKELEQLLWNASYDEETKKKYYAELEKIQTEERYKKVKAGLLTSQKDDSNRIANGDNYNQSDIKKTKAAHV